ncbi:hypothetical protein ATF84_1158 [[Clostridium] innocuum]|nr:hypothetical protein ATF84_12432 [[Clostridium] innocuum]PWJ11981.1 hypothetical protein ATF84_1158 [[Clostridium] innocuum]SSA47537.1 hypothetical protein SAMN04487929_1158 [[Clostridium] innocuum]SSA49263.1 hypothetical protein SAMN04487929_12432 [[Clostridium] innocuum]
MDDKQFRKYTKWLCAVAAVAWALAIIFVKYC